MRGTRHSGASITSMRSVRRLAAGALAVLVAVDGASAQSTPNFNFPLRTLFNGTTCTQYEVNWQYNTLLLLGSTPFTLIVTNVGVPQSAPIFPSSSDSGSSSASSTDGGGSQTTLPGSIFTPPGASSTISSETVSGTFPPSNTGLRARQFASTTITEAIAQNIPVNTNGHSLEWNVDVPSGWYIFNATEPSGSLLIPQSSERFFIAQGDTSCIGASSSSAADSGSATGSPTSLPSSTSGGKIKPGVIAGAVIAALAILGLAGGFWFFFSSKLVQRQGRRRPSQSAWGQVNSHDSRAPRDGAAAAAFGVGAAGMHARAADLYIPHSVSALSHRSNADVDPDLDSSSLEEKSPSDAYAPGVVRSQSARYSAGSSASGHVGHRPQQRASSNQDHYALGPISRTTSAAPSPLPGAAPGGGGGGPPKSKRTPRKAVPQYDEREMAAAATPTDDENTMIGSHGSMGGVLKKTPSKEMLGLGNASTGQVHYLMPDLPPAARRE